MKLSHFRISHFVLCALFFLFVSCDRNRLYEQNSLVDQKGWYYQSRIPFDVQITDTTKFYNVYANLRVGSDYKYSNIFFWFHVINPTKEIDKRRVEMLLANERGKWLGRGLGDMYDYQFPVYTKIKFPQSGFYRFEIEQNMREDTLMNIKSVGVRIEEWKTEE